MMLGYWYNVHAVDNITREKINESIATEDSIRLSNDESKGILKFDTRYPNSMIGYTMYDEAWMLQYLIDNAVDWE